MKIFEFAFEFISDVLEKSPFEKILDLPNCKEDANNLNLCVRIYERICRLKTINNSLKVKSTRIAEEIQRLFKGGIFLMKNFFFLSQISISFPL